MNCCLLCSDWRLGYAPIIILLLGFSWRAGATDFNYDPSGNLRSISNSTPSPPFIVTQPRSALADVGSAASFSVLARGSAPLVYQWQLNATNIPDATTDTLLLTNVALTDFGTYRVIVSNAANFVTSSNALLQLDSDHDGMADAWEITYFGSITNRDGFQDFDGDGVSDRDEFLEGTDPKNFSSANPRLIVYSDNGEVLVTPNVPFFTNNQTITLTGTPNPGLQFLGYIGQPLAGGNFYSMRTNPAPLRFGAPGITGSQVVRAIFGLPIPFSLNVTNGWRIDQAGWFGQTNVTHDGIAAAQSARILGAPEALLELTNVVMSGEGIITFWWKVDGTDADRLQFRRNNLLRSGAIGTNTDWQQRTYYLPAGLNVVRWEYVKHNDQVSEYNGLSYAPADAGWVDQVSYQVWTNALLDADGNGLPDIWEYKYFDKLGIDPKADSDNDGISNLDEYIDGTDPTSNASLLPRLAVLNSGGGTVTRSPDLPKYTLGQTVQLQAVPDPTNYFVIWGGAVSGTNITNSIFMNANKTIAATFGLPLGYVLDAPSLTWTRGGVIGFFGQTNFSYDGLHSAQAGPVGFHQESAMDTSFSGPGTLVFWWKAACATNLNFGRFLIDGVEQPGKITGDMPWMPQSFSLNAGTHSLHWGYSNNTAVVSMTNGVWVDRVTFSSSNIAPSIVSQPSDALVPQGSSPAFQVVVTGTPPFSYQWYRNGASLSGGATGVTLTLTNVSPTQAGLYSVQISNQVQSVFSSNAALTVVPVPPVNDDFANKAFLTGTNPVLGYTFGGTRESGEPYHANIFGSHSVWWSWTAPSNGNFNLNAIATNLDGTFMAAVYTGNVLGSLAEVRSGVGTSFTVNGLNLSILSFDFSATSGTTYAIAADHAGFADGFFSLAITPVTKPILLNTMMTAARSFNFQFAEPPGSGYTIEVSSDLQFWTPIANGIVPPNGNIKFSDPASSSPLPRFYRVKRL